MNGILITNDSIMKKLRILLFSILISFNSYGQELNSLFGVNLYENAEKYVSSNYINSNTFKNQETIGGYFDLIMTDKIKTKSPYASYYEFIIDKDNIVHRIYGSMAFVNLDICQAVQKQLTSKFEEKYQVEFEYFDKTYPQFKIYRNYFNSDSGSNVSIQCREWNSTKEVKMQIMNSSREVLKKINEFYDAGL